MEYGLDYEKREISARRIQACWRSHQDQKLFHYLMNTMRSAEQCVTPAVLRQISPLEANLLRDHSLQFKVRFRFSGCQFPPVIVFKIFHTARGGHYLYGKKLFRPSNQATADSCRMMGNRRFMDLLMEDELQWQGRKISDPTDITCIRDYIQYSSHLDSIPACLGGRENGWRHLSLQVLSRNNLWKEDLSKTTARSARTLRPPPALPSSTVSRRRSSQSKSMAAHWKHLYTRREDQRVLIDEQDKKPTVHNTDDAQTAEDQTEEKVINPDPSDEDSEWEEEAEKLCCWTGQLTLDSIDQLDYI